MTWISAGGRPRIFASQFRAPWARWVGRRTVQPPVRRRVREDAARLHRDRGDALAGHPLADPVGGLLERLAGVAGREALAEGDVAWRALVQHRRAVGRRVQRGGDRGEVVVVDDDELGGVGGALRGVGDDQGDRLAGPQDLVAGEHRVGGFSAPGGRPSAPGSGPTPCAARSCAVKTAATPAAWRASVTSMPVTRACASGLRTTKACSVPCGVEVVDVPAAPGEQRRVLPAGQRLPDQAHALGLSRAGDRPAQGAAGEDLGQVGAVGAAGVLVAEEADLAACRAGGDGDLGGGRGQRFRRGRCAREEAFCLAGAVGAGGDSRDGDLGAVDEAVPQPYDRADAGQRQVAGRVRELLVGAAPGVRGVDADVGDDLVLGQVRRVDALEEVVEGYLARLPVRGGDDDLPRSGRAGPPGGRRPGRRAPPRRRSCPGRGPGGRRGPRGRP